MYTAKRGYRPGDEPVAGYHLTKFLGRGQFGEVWQAKAPGGMQVALKIIDLGEREGLKEFSGLLQVKDIRHANLVEFVACWVKTESGQVLDELPTDPVAALSPRDSAIEIGGTMLFDASGASPTRPVELIVAMSLGSKTLYRRLQEANVGKEQKLWVGLPEEELLDYMEQAARGIDYLNQRGIIHGDIKPQNLLIVGDSVKVCDFGLARAVTNLRMTQSGMGTVAYAAPELFEGKPHIQSDQYCLAVSYIELRTGALPFEEPNPYKVIELHRNGRLDLGKLSRGERGVVRRATEIRPDRRWPSCTEMARKLRETRHQERTGGGGGWFSFLRSKPDLAVTQQLPPTEEPAVEEPAGGHPDVAAKKGSGKKDSGRKKTGAQSPAAARAVQTVRRRGDDTDAIAATVASEEIAELPRPARPSTVGRIAKACVWLCVIGAMAFAGYRYAIPYLLQLRQEGVAGDGGGSGKEQDEKGDKHKDDRQTVPPISRLGIVTGLFQDAVRKGDFKKAGEEHSKAYGDLVAQDYDEFKKLCKEWGEPATNLVLQQLNKGDLAAPVAARRLMDADAQESFVKVAGRVPEGVWQEVLQRWVQDFDARVAEGKFTEAATIVTEAKRALPALRYEQLCTAIRKAWSEPATNRILQQLKDGKIAARAAYASLKDADAEESFVTLAGRVPAGVWQAVLEQWMKDFDQLLASELEKAVEEWKAVNKWQDAPSELISPADRNKLRGRIQDEWKQKRLEPRLTNEDFRSAQSELGTPLAKEIFDAAEIDGIREEIRPKWKGYFDNLLKAAAPEAVAKACEELKDVGKSLDSPEEYSLKAAQIGKVWSAGIRGFVAKGEWEAAKKLFDSVPEDLIPPQEHKAELAGIQTAWDKDFYSLFAKDRKDKDWDGALKKLSNPPAGLFQPPEVQERQKGLQTAWDADFSLLAKSDLPAARKMMDSAPRALFTGSEMEDRQARLGMMDVEQRKRNFHEAFAGLLAKQDFAAAKEKLDEAAARNLVSAQEAQAKEKELREPWFAWICANWSKTEQAEAFRSQVSGFLKASPGPAEANDARLLRARALVHLGKKTNHQQHVVDAAEDLQHLAKAAELPADRGYLRDALLVIASTKKPADWRRDWAKPPENPAAPWKLDSWEEDRLRETSESMDRPAKVAKLKSLFADPKLGSARESLGLVEQLFPASPWKIPEEEVALVTGDVPRGLRKRMVLSPEGVQAQDLERAILWLRAAHERLPDYPEVSAALRATLQRRFALRVAEAPGPSPEDMKSILEWEKLSQASSGEQPGADELWARAWRVECTLVLGPKEEAASARDRLVSVREELLKVQPAYGHYLLCRALRAASTPVWSGIVRELKDLAPAMEGPEPILKAQGRVKVLARLIAEAAQNQREQARPWQKLAQVPFNPFPRDAEQYANLLKTARKFVDDKDDNDRALKASLTESLALAAFHEPKRENGPVWLLSRELLPLPEASKQPDLLPLLFAGVSSFWQQPQLVQLPADDPQFATAVRATTQLLQEFSKDEAGEITKDAVPLLYQSVLQPVLENPVLEAAAKKKDGGELISDLSAATAKFLNGQKGAEWPLPKSARSVYHVIEGQATRAIDLYPKGKADAKLADYFALRGEARAYKADFSAAEVLADTEAALKLQPGLPMAWGIRAYALLMRGLDQPRQDQILKDLAESIVSGEKAKENCKDRRQYPRYLLNLANAHLLTGNYETDPKKKQEHFDLARGLASDAAKLEHDYGDEARLLLGNIYEDLASQARENPEENYRRAEEQFSEVLAKNNLSADALCSLARCRYKAVVNTNLKPQALGFPNRDAVLKKCKDDLENAVRYSIQDRVRIEASCYLGLVCQEQGDWAEAERSLEQAAKLAEQSKAATAAAYVYQWALLPYSHAKHLLETRKPDDPEVAKLLEEADQHAEELRKMPAGGRVIPAKEAPYLQGLVLLARKKYDEALEAFGKGLPEDLAQVDSLDVRLLLARAGCSLTLCKFDPNGTLAKDSVAPAKASLRDASRALEVATDAGDQADASFCQANAHIVLARAEGEDRNQEVGEFVKSIRKAVDLAQQGTRAVKYRIDGAGSFISVASIYERSERQQEAIGLLQEAKGWLEEALKREEDPKEKKRISAQLQVAKNELARLQGQPAPAPPADPGN